MNTIKLVAELLVGKNNSPSSSCSSYDNISSSRSTQSSYEMHLGQPWLYQLGPGRCSSNTKYNQVTPPGCMSNTKSCQGGPGWNSHS